MIQVWGFRSEPDCVLGNLAEYPLEIRVQEATAARSASPWGLITG